MACGRFGRDGLIWLEVPPPYPKSVQSIRKRWVKSGLRVCGGQLRVGQVIKEGVRQASCLSREVIVERCRWVRGSRVLLLQL